MAIVRQIMKWRILLTYFVTVIVQMAALLVMWWITPPSESVLIISITIFIFLIGIAGSVVIAKIKRGTYPENRVIFWCVNVAGSLISSIGIFAIYFPLMWVLSQSVLTASILILGCLAPLYMPYVINKMVYGYA